MSKEKIIIFGAGKLGQKLFEIMNPVYPVSFFCDNDEEKWGTLFCNVPIISPTELLKHLQNNPERIYIANRCFYLGIARQLEKMGIRDYLVYSHIQNGFQNTILPKLLVENEMNMLSDFFRVQDGKFCNPLTDIERNLFKDLTIIIPTWNTDLSPCLNYLDHMLKDIPVEIVLLDGSNDKIFTYNSEFIKQYTNLTISHFAVEAMEFHEFICTGLQYVKTEYCMILRDDDYIVAISIVEALGILNNDSDISMVRGRLAYFCSNVYERDGMKYIENDFNNIMVCDMPNQPLLSESSEERASYYSNNYTHDVYYAVTRKNNLLKTLKAVTMHKSFYELELYFKELLYLYTYVLMNRIQVIESIIYFRDLTPSHIYDSLASHFSKEILDNNVRIFKQTLIHICKSHNIALSSETIETLIANLLLFTHPRYKLAKKYKEDIIV